MKNEEIVFKTIGKELLMERNKYYCLTDFFSCFGMGSLEYTPNTIRIRKGRIAVGWSNLRVLGKRFKRTKSRRYWLLPPYNHKQLELLNFWFPEFSNNTPDSRVYYYGKPMFGLYHSLSEDLGALCEDV